MFKKTLIKMLTWLLVLALMAGYMPVIPVAAAFQVYELEVIHQNENGTSTATVFNQHGEGAHFSEYDQIIIIADPGENYAISGYRIEPSDVDGVQYQLVGDENGVLNNGELIFYMPAQNVKVYFSYNYTGTYTVTLTQTEGGEIGFCREFYAENYAGREVRVDIVADTNAGYVYNGYTITGESGTVYTGNVYGFSNPAAGATLSFTMPAENVTVQGLFKKDDTEYPITITTEGQGTASVQGGAAKAKKGDKVQLVITPDTANGYALYSWTLNGSNPSFYDGTADYSFIMPGAEMTAKVVFKKQHEVAFSAGAHGSVGFAEGYSNPIFEGDYFTVKPVPESGYGVKDVYMLLNGVKSLGTEDDPNRFSMPAGGGATIVAEFAKQVLVTLNEPAEGTLVIVGCEETPMVGVEGQTIHLAATLPEGYEKCTIIATGESGTPYPVEENKLTLPGENVTLSVAYLKQYKVNISDVQNGTVTANLEKAFPGETVNLTAHPVLGYKLSSISVTCGEECGEETVALTELEGNSASFTMPKGNVSISAVFDKDPNADMIIKDKVLHINPNRTVAALPEGDYESIIVENGGTLNLSNAGAPVNVPVLNAGVISGGYYANTVTNAGTIRYGIFHGTVIMAGGTIRDGAFAEVQMHGGGVIEKVGAVDVITGIGFSLQDKWLTVTGNEFTALPDLPDELKATSVTVSEGVTLAYDKISQYTLTANDGVITDDSFILNGKALFVKSGDFPGLPDGLANGVQVDLGVEISYDKISNCGTLLNYGTVKGKDFILNGTALTVTGNEFAGLPEGMASSVTINADVEVAYNKISQYTLTANNGSIIGDTWELNGSDLTVTGNDFAGLPAGLTASSVTVNAGVTIEYAKVSAYGSVTNHGSVTGPNLDYWNLTNSGMLHVMANFEGGIPEELRGKVTELKLSGSILLSTVQDYMSSDIPVSFMPGASLHASGWLMRYEDEIYELVVPSGQTADLSTVPAKIMALAMRVVNNGAITGTPAEGCAVPVFNYGTIEGGTFSESVYNENGTIEGGTFSGAVTNENEILGGTFTNAVTNKQYIYGGTFTGTVTNDSEGIVFNVASGVTFGSGATLVNHGVLACDDWMLEKRVLTIQVDKSVDLDNIPANVKSLAEQVVNKGTIEGGSCAVPVTNRGYIEDGTFTGAVTNEYRIYDGTFTGTVTNETSGIITGGSFQTINNQAGARLWAPDVTYKTLNNQGRVETNEYYFDASIATLGLVKNIALNQIPKDFRDQTEELYIDSFFVTVNVDELNELPKLESIQNLGTIAGNGWNVKDSILTVGAGKEVDLGSIPTLVMKNASCVDNYGTITGTPDAGCADPVFNHGTIEGGTFTGSVTNQGNIEGGTFKGTVTNEAGGTIVRGSFKKIVNKENGRVSATVAGLTYGSLDNQGIFITRDYEFNAATSTVDLWTDAGFAMIPDAWKAQTRKIVIHSDVTLKAEDLATLSNLASIDNLGTIAGTGWELKKRTADSKDVLYITGSVDLKDVPANIMNMVDEIEVLNEGSLTNTATGSCTIKVTNNGTVSGGKYVGTFVNNGAITGGEFNGPTTNSGTVSGGSFGASFTNYSAGYVNNAVFTGDVTNKGTINSSTFTGGVLTTSGASSYIGDSTFTNITIYHQAGDIRGKFLGSARIDEYNGRVMSLHNVNGEDILLTGNSSELITELNTQTHQDAATVIWYHGTEANPGAKVAEDALVPLIYASFHSVPVVKGNGFMLHKGVLTINGDATMTDLKAMLDSVTSIVMESAGTLTGDGWELVEKDGKFVLTIEEGKSVDLSTIPAKIMAAVTEVDNYGTITGTPTGGCADPVINSGTIEGGTFSGIVTNKSGGTISGGIFNALVKNQSNGIIEGGTFNKLTSNKSGGTITSGTFAAEVSNSGTIECAKFLKDTLSGNSPLKVIHSVNGVDTAITLSKTHPSLNVALEAAGVSLGDGKILLYKNDGAWEHCEKGTEPVPLVYTAYAVGSQVTVAADPAAGGTVTFTAAEGTAYFGGDHYMPAGTTVTVTITENAPYHFESLTVQDSNGNRFTTQFVENKEQTYTFTFTMPAVPVTVTAVFALPSGVDWELSLLDGKFVLTLGSGFNGRLDKEPLLSMLGYAASIENFGTILGDGWKLETSTLTIEEGKSIDLSTVPEKIMALVTKVVNNGTITGTPTGGCADPVTNYGTIQSGTFSDSVTNHGKIQSGIFTGSVHSALMGGSPVGTAVISGGIFNGTVENTNKATITDGVFSAASTVTNDGATISGGTFSGTVENTNNATISGGTFSGTVTNNGATIKGGRFEGTDCYVLVTETTATLYVTGNNVKLPSYPGSLTHLMVEKNVTVAIDKLQPDFHENLKIQNNGTITADRWTLAGQKLTVTGTVTVQENILPRNIVDAANELEKSIGALISSTGGYWTLGSEFLTIKKFNGFDSVPELLLHYAKNLAVSADPEGKALDYETNQDKIALFDSVQGAGTIEADNWIRAYNSSTVKVELTIKTGAEVNLKDIPANILNYVDALVNNGTILGEGWKLEGGVLIIEKGKSIDLNSIPAKIMAAVTKVVNNGTITDTPAAGISAVVDNYGTILKGTYNGNVNNFGTISGGSFAKQTINGKAGSITGGDFSGTVQSSGSITDGDFTGAVQNYGSITGGEFSGTVQSSGTVEGGIFNSIFENYTGGVVKQPATGDAPEFYFRVDNQSGATISGGIFEGSSTVENSGSITGGEFSGAVENSGSITGGEFSSTVENSGSITDGDFTGAVENQAGATISGGIFEGSSTVENYGSILGGRFELNEAAGNVKNETGGKIDGGVFATQYYELDVQNNILTLKASKELIELKLPSWYDGAEVEELHVNSGVTLENLDNSQREMTVYNYGTIGSTFGSYIAGSSGVLYNYGMIETLEVVSDGVVQNLGDGVIHFVKHRISVYGADYEMARLLYTFAGTRMLLLDALDLAGGSEGVWFRKIGETLTAVAEDEPVPMQMQQFVLLRPYELENNIVRIPAGLGQDEVKQQLCKIVEGRLEAQINPADSENQLYDLTATFVRQEGDEVTVAVAANGTRAPGYLESNKVTVYVDFYQPVSADWVTSGTEAGVVKFGASVSGTLHITRKDGSSEEQMTEEVTNITEYDAASWLWDQIEADGTVLAWVETAENGVTYPLTQKAEMDFKRMKTVTGFQPASRPAEIKVYYGSALVLNAEDFMGGFEGTLKDRPEVALRIPKGDDAVTYGMPDKSDISVEICFKDSGWLLRGPALSRSTKLKVYPNPDHFDLSINYENEEVRVAYSQNAPSEFVMVRHVVRYEGQNPLYLPLNLPLVDQFGAQMTLAIEPDIPDASSIELSIDIPARPELEVALTHVTHEKNTFHVTKPEEGYTVQYKIGGEWQQLTGGTLDVDLTQTAEKTVQFRIPADATAKRFKKEVSLTAKATPRLDVTGGTGLVGETLTARWLNDNRVNEEDIRYAWIWANTGTAARGTEKEYTPVWSDAGKNLQALATCEVNGVTYATVSVLIPVSLPAPLYAVDYEAETLTVSLPEGASMPPEGFAYQASWGNGNDVEWRDATLMVDGKAVISLTGVLDDENDNDELTAVKLELLEGKTVKASSTTTLDEDEAVPLKRSTRTPQVPAHPAKTPVSLTFSYLNSWYEYRLTKDGTVYTHDGNGVFSGLTGETEYALEGRISGSNEEERFAGKWRLCYKVTTGRKYELSVNGLADDSKLHHTYLVDGNVPVISLRYGNDIFTAEDGFFTCTWKNLAGDVLLPDPNTPFFAGNYIVSISLTEEAGKAYLLNNGTVRVLVEQLDLDEYRVEGKNGFSEYNDGKAVALPVMDVYVLVNNTRVLLPATEYEFEHPEGAMFTAGEGQLIRLEGNGTNVIGTKEVQYTILPKKVTVPAQNLTATYSGRDVKAEDLAFANAAFGAEWSVASAYDWKDAAGNVLTAAPKNAGTYKATLKLYHNDHGDNYDVEPVEECTVTITPLGLTLNEDYDNDLGLKEYDGTTEVPGLPKALNLAGLIFEGDDVQGEMDGSFASKNVSEEQTVITTYTLTGTDAGNYYVKDGIFGDVVSTEGTVTIAETSGMISPRSFTATYTFVKNERVWDGSGIIPKEHLAIELNVLEGDDVTLVMDDLIAITANSDVGSYSQAENEITVGISDSNSLTGDDVANYKFERMVPADENLTYTIKPMDLADETMKWHLDQLAECLYAGDHTVDLPAEELQMQVERKGMTYYMDSSELEFVLTGDDVNGLPRKAQILVKAAENASRVTGSAYFPVDVQHAPVEITSSDGGVLAIEQWNPGYEKTVDEMFGNRVLVTSIDHAPVEKDYFTRVMKDANGNEVEKAVNAGDYTVTFVLNEEGAKRYVSAGENELTSYEWVYPMDVRGNAFTEQTFENPVYTGNAVYPTGMLKVMIHNYDVPFEIPVDGELVRFVPIEGENCVNAGTAKARIEACHPNMTGYMDVTYRILPCKVTVEEIVFEEKIYDGTLAVTVDQVVLKNLAEGDEVSASAIRAELLSPDAGENKANVQLRLEGEDSVNYFLTEEQVQWPVTVRKAQPAAIAWPAEKTLVFGTKLSEVALGANMQWLNPDHIPEVHETTAKVRYVPADTRNYDYSNVKLEHDAPIKVLPAEAILTVENKTVQKGDSLSFTYTWEGLVEGFAKPTVTLWVDSTEVGTHDIKVTVTDADNYAVKVNHGKLTVTGPEPEVTFRPTPTVKPDATPTAKPDATPTAKPDATPTAKPDATPTAKPDATPTAKPDATPTAKPDATPTAKPDATPTAKPDATPTAKPDATPTAKPDATPTAKPDATATAKPEATATVKPEATATAKPDATPTAKPDATPTAKPDATPAVPEVPVKPEDVIIPETDQAATGMMGEGQRYGDLQLVFDGEGNPRDYELNIVPQAGKVETMLHIVACQEAEGNADRSLVLPLKTLKMLSDRHVADCTLFETEEVLVFFRHAEVLQGKLAALVGYVTTGGIVTENVLQHVDMLDAVEALTAEQLGQVTLEVHVEKTESGFKVSMLLGFENDKWDVTHLIESFTLCMNVEKLVTEENKANFTELYTVVRTDENGEETLVPAVLCIVPDELPADMQDVCASYTVSMPEQEGDSITVTHDAAAELDAYRKHVLMCEGALSGVYELRAAQ